MKFKRLNKYQIPTQPHEVTLNECFSWLLDVEPLKPAKWAKLEQEPDEKERLNILGAFSDKFINGPLRLFFETNLCFFSGLNMEQVKRFDMAQLTELYYLTQGAILPPKYEYKEVLKVGKEFYKLPGVNMIDSILFQYAESDQLEQNAERNEQNKIFIFADIMAILLRKEGEPLYLADNAIKARANGFKTATMAQSWQVYNYFQETKKAVRAKFGSTLFSKPSREEKKAGVKGLQDSFGWLLTIKRLAEKKIFDISGFNSQDSVLNTNTWECLTHLAADNAINAYKGRLYDIKTK